MRTKRTKITAITIVALLSLGLSGCNIFKVDLKSNDPAPTSSASPTETPTPTPTPTEIPVHESLEEDQTAIADDTPDEDSRFTTEDANGATIVDLEDYLHSAERIDRFTKLVTNVGHAVITKAIKGDYGETERYNDTFEKLTADYTGWGYVANIPKVDKAPPIAFAHVWWNPGSDTKPSIDFSRSITEITLAETVDGQYTAIEINAPGDDSRFWSWQIKLGDRVASIDYDGDAFIKNDWTWEEQPADAEMPYTPETLEEFKEFDELVLTGLEKVANKLLGKS